MEHQEKEGLEGRSSDSRDVRVLGAPREGERRDVRRAEALRELVELADRLLLLLALLRLEVLDAVAVNVLVVLEPRVLRNTVLHRRVSGKSICSSEEGGQRTMYFPVR